jgi:CHAT domain-containing protein/tetratricopeptide (TPR) repeat protein
MSNSHGKDPSESPPVTLVPSQSVLLRKVLRSLCGAGSVSIVMEHALTVRRTFRYVAVVVIASGLWPDQGGASSSGLEKVRELNDAGRYSRAESAGRKLLAEAELSSSETIEIAHILDELAVSLRRGSGVQSGDALAVCERSLEIKRWLTGEQSLDFALSLHNLGTLQAYRGDFGRARTALEKARILRERQLGLDHADVASTLIPLSHVLRQEGDVAAARSLLDRAVSILEKSSNEPELVRALLTRGYSEYDSGDYAEAVSTWERALDTATRTLPKDHPDLGVCHQNLGALYTETGDYEQARKHCGMSLKIRKKALAPGHPLIAGSLEAIGYLDELRTDYPSARKSYAQAVRIQEHVLGTSHPQTARLWTRLAGTELRSGNHRGALDLLQRALAVQESTLGPMHPDLAWTWDGLAAVEEANGRYDVALRDYEKAREIRIHAYGANHPDVSISMVLLSRTYSGLGNRPSALEAALESARINLENLAVATQVLAERHALAYASIQSSGHDLALALVSTGPVPADSEIVRVWSAWIQGRNVVLDEMVRRQRFLGASTDSSLGEIGSRLGESRRRLSQLLVRGLEGDDVQAYGAKVESLRTVVERLERQIGSWKGGVSRGSPAGVDYKAVVGSIPPGSALVAYSWYGPASKRRYAAFVQRSGAAPKLVRLGDARTIEDRITSWLRLASAAEGGSDPKSLETSCRKAGNRLRAAIWDPIEVHVRNVARVFVVPDGALHRVNLAALPDGAGYVVETGPLIHYLPAERDLLEEHQSPKGKGLLAVGGPDFDAGRPSQGPASARRGGERECMDLSQHPFEPLPGTLKEVKDIAALWSDSSNVTVRTGLQASELSVRREGPGRRVVHLATHGFFLDGECVAERAGGRGIAATVPASQKAVVSVGSRLAGTLSGLALSGANNRSSVGTDDGILTAEEIASLNLVSVEWVVLSACDTGLGRPQAGEGILGMRRAFQIAGARTVIMSLWAVDDEATRSWMTELYRARLKKRLGTAEAVRDASLHVLRERRAQARSVLPFYWAGFVASGQWN